MHEGVVRGTAVHWAFGDCRLVVGKAGEEGTVGCGAFFHRVLDSGRGSIGESSENLGVGPVCQMTSHTEDGHFFGFRERGREREILFDPDNLFVGGLIDACLGDTEQVLKGGVRLV